MSPPYLCPYRDWLCILGRVVLALQESVLTAHWSMARVHRLRKHRLINTFQQIISSLLTLMCHLSMVTHLVSGAIGLLRRRGLVLWWSTKTKIHTCHVNESQMYETCFVVRTILQIPQRTHNRDNNNNSKLKWNTVPWILTHALCFCACGTSLWLYQWWPKE